MQTDAMAVGTHHGHGKGDSAPKENKRTDDSKYHTVLNHSTEGETKSSSSSSGGVKLKGPEEIRVDNDQQTTVRVGDNGMETMVSSGAFGVVHEDDVTAAHPESQTQQNKKKPKADNFCGTDPYDC
ncbi:MAG: hypothetical protein JNJ47_01085 [Alphaproteobacteria bacterium]|nr:hypothetical protein [Alphaproteobacteria bacterium]